MPYDPAIHHRRSIRLHDYDYSNAGAYFITIVVKKQACVLGEIAEGEVRLSKIGQAVQETWESLPIRFPGIELDVSAIMPNHMHGIVVIADHGGSHAPSLLIPASHRASAQDRRRMMLPKIIGYLKMNSARRANAILSTSGASFWQRDYYEHVIRDEADLERIRTYIITNPLRWQDDPLHLGYHA